MAETKAKKEVFLGTGRRKTSVARIRISEGSGKILINGRAVENYFTEIKDRNAVMAPLLLCEQQNRLDVTIKVHGGGYSGQAGAILQGLARALKLMFGKAEGVDAPPEGETGGFVKKLRDSDFLTRDDRMKERKKYGRKGARKSFQFSKR
ncbi:MAG: 30S ribosomal protein S9 [Planctomycetota bacterium]